MKRTIGMHVFVGFAAILLFAACEQQSEQPRSRAAMTPSPRAAKTAVKKDKDKNKLSKKQVVPTPEEKQTTDGRAILGSLMLVEPNEIRLYFAPTFPPNKRASVRATVVVDGGSTIPSYFNQTTAMEYLAAHVDQALKPPVNVTLRLSADGYDEAEIKTTVAVVASSEKKTQVGASASNPKEYSQLIKQEMLRLETMASQGRLEFLPEFAQQVRLAVEGLVLTSGEQAEMKLQKPLVALDEAITSMTQAKARANVQEARSAFEEFKKVIEHDVAPFFVAE
jgi:hypothetical protein